MNLNHLPDAFLLDFGPRYSCGDPDLQTPPCSPPPLSYIGLGQKEAQLNHELLFDHA